MNLTDRKNKKNSQGIHNKSEENPRRYTTDLLKGAEEN